MACPPSGTHRRCRTGARTGALATHPVRRLAQHAGLEREPVGPAPIVRRRTPVSSSRASAATCAARVPVVSPSASLQTTNREQSRSRERRQARRTRFAQVGKACWYGPVPSDRARCVKNSGTARRCTGRSRMRRSTRCGPRSPCRRWCCAQRRVQCWPPRQQPGRRRCRARAGAAGRCDRHRCGARPSVGHLPGLLPGSRRPSGGGHLESGDAPGVVARPARLNGFRSSMCSAPRPGR